MTVIFTPSTTPSLSVHTTPIKVVCESAYNKVITDGENGREIALFLQDVNEEYQIPSGFYDGSPFGVWEMISFEASNWTDSMSVTEFKAYLEYL